jgi:hypothetical protein
MLLESTESPSNSRSVYTNGASSLAKFSLLRDCKEELKIAPIRFVHKLN